MRKGEELLGVSMSGRRSSAKPRPEDSGAAWAAAVGNAAAQRVLRSSRLPRSGVVAVPGVLSRAPLGLHRQVLEEEQEENVESGELAAAEASEEAAPEAESPTPDGGDETAVTPDEAGGAPAPDAMAAEIEEDEELPE